MTRQKSLIAFDAGEAIALWPSAYMTKKWRSLIVSPRFCALQDGREQADRLLFVRHCTI